MNNKHSVLKRIVASLLVIVMVATAADFSVFAEKPTESVPAVKNETPTAKETGASGGAISWENLVAATQPWGDTSECGNFRSYLIVLQRIENMAKDNATYQAAKLADADLTQCRYSASDNYLTDYPNCFENIDIKNLDQYALVSIKDTTHIVTNRVPSGSVQYLKERV